MIDLQANFRSRARLLDAINGVFERLMTREAAEILYDQTHRLAPGREYPAAELAGRPVLHRLTDRAARAAEQVRSRAAAVMPIPATATADADDFELDRAEREAVLVARRIREMMGQSGDCPRMQVLDRDGQTYRPIRYRDIVLLLRSMRLQGGPVRRRAAAGRRARPRRERDRVLRVGRGAGHARAAGGARQPAAGRPAGRRTPQPDRAARRPRRTPSPASGSPTPRASGRSPSTRRSSRYAAEQDDELAGLLRDFLQRLHGWRAAAHRRPLAETVWSIYEQTGYLAYVSGLAGGEQRVANLMYLYERAAQFGTFQRQGLGRFMEFLEQLREESDLGQPSIASEAEDVVRIMSVHRSKGLEFPVVILPDLGKAINLSDCQGPVLFDRELGLGMSVVDDAKQARYPSLASTLVQERLRRQSMAEELRVLYVAMTRAKEHLILVGTCAEEAPERWRGRWADHRGALPADSVHSARCLVDWIGAVARCCARRVRGDHPGHSPRLGGGRAMAGPRETAATRLSTRTSAARPLIRLEPLDPAPPPNPDADEVIARLSFQYPYQRYAELGAVRAVTCGEADDPGLPLAGAAASPACGGRRTCRCQSSSPPARPRHPRTSDRPPTSSSSTWTSPARSTPPTSTCRSPGWSNGVCSTARRCVGGPRRHSLVRRDGGRAAAARTKAGCFASSRSTTPPPPRWADPADPAPDPRDRVMVRGRLDVLVPGDDGLTVVDFKTGPVAPEAVAARIEHHRPQVEQYRRAVQAITGRPVARAFLVFLSARQVPEV